MAINLAVKYSDKIAGYFGQSSFIKGRTGGKYDFMGAKSLRVYSLDTVPLVDYQRSGTERYGDPGDIKDRLQEMTMSQDKAFVGIIDKGDASEQMGVKNAMTWLRHQMDERVTPVSDKYALSQFIKHAGKVKGVPAKPTKANIVEILAEGAAWLDDRLVPQDGRTLFISGEMYAALRSSPEFTGLESLGEKALARGVVGEFMGAKVVRVPTPYMPVNCYFLLAYKESLLFPWKISDTKVHADPPGINGDRIEGRFVYDAFVLGSRCDGVYACVLANDQQAAPAVTCTTPGTSTMTITSAGATLIRYTTDGSDPRYSLSAATYSAAVATTGWAKGALEVKAVAYKDGIFTSDVTVKSFTVV